MEQDGTSDDTDRDHKPVSEQNTPVPSTEQSASPADSTEHFVLTIGDIGVTPHWVVTPNGTTSLAGSRWIVSDQTRTETKIPAWAIVLAIVFALACLLGLLFLLAKETRTTGYVEVTVQGGSLFHATQIPVGGPGQVAQIRQQVNQAQSMAAAASAG